MNFKFSTFGRLKKKVSKMPLFTVATKDSNGLYSQTYRLRAKNINHAIKRYFHAYLRENKKFNPAQWKDFLTECNFYDSDIQVYSFKDKITRYYK